MKYSSINLSSEEDVKLKLIIPYLSDLGFNFDELDFETSLSFIFGTKNYEKRKVRGRLDILCKREGINLFVLEVKLDNKNINKDDIEQAISYARFVHPIAPYAIISNGKSTMIYNVITKCELKDKSAIDPYQQLNISIDEDLRLRYDALRNFIGYSTENVQVFTQGQIELRMLTLLGDVNDLNKKFIPEVFVKRNNLNQEFESFLKSDDKCFVIVGESGVGKTNCICDLAFNVSQNNIVLFFNGTLLNGTLMENIKNDFNWIFPQRLNAIEILKKLEGLADKNSYKILIFIDAIDEVMNSNFNLELNELIKNLKYFKKIKVCVTCKTYDWVKFEIIKGQTSHIKEFLFNKCVFTLEKFNELELNDIYIKYKDVFKYFGILTEKLKNEVNLGIMFRILAEVYQGKELPNEITKLEIFNNYLQEKIIKIENENCKNILKEIGKLIIQNDTVFDFHKNTGRVDEELLREKLNISINDRLLPEFFSHNILTRYEQEGRNYIGFYFNSFKDYIITVLTYNLPNLKGEKFTEAIKELMRGHNGQESVLWYISVAFSEQLQLFKQYYIERADIYIKTYNDILKEKLLQLKEMFDPFTNIEIGILITDDLKFDMLDFALIRIGNEKNKYVKIIPKGNFNRDLLFRDFDVRIMRSTRYSFMSLHPKQAASEDILKQLEKIVKTEKLNENNNVDLALEKIQAVLYYHSEKFGFEKINNKYKISDIKPLYPINVVDCLNNIKSKMRKNYIIDQRISRISKSGNGTLNSVEHQLVYDAAEIEKEELEFIKSNKEFPIESSGLQGMLYKYMNILFRNEIEIIDEPYLPLPDLSETDSHDRSMKLLGFFQSPTKSYCLYSEKQLIRYVSQFFLTFIEEYKTVIETNFNCIKNYFELYSYLPVHYKVKINLKGMGIEYGFKRSENGKNQVEVTVDENNSGFTKDNGIITSSYHRIDSMFNQFTTSLSDKDLDEISPLRGFLYSRLKNEIGNVIIKLRMDFE